MKRELYLYSDKNRMKADFYDLASKDPVNAALVDFTYKKKDTKCYFRWQGDYCSIKGFDWDLVIARGNIKQEIIKMIIPNIKKGVKKNE